MGTGGQGRQGRQGRQGGVKITNAHCLIPNSQFPIPNSHINQEFSCTIIL
ncbi:hypothetical protein [Tolypothrix sp. VBCCA 56010]